MAKLEGEDDSELRARLAKLSEALDAQRKSARGNGAAPGGGTGNAMARAWSLGARVVSEFVAAILVGGGIGWAIDEWFHSGPWGLVVFLMLGMAAGFWNIYRIAAPPEPPARDDSK